MKHLTMLKVLILFHIFIQVGCGYSIMGGNHSLPFGAKSLGLYPIENQTFVSELDTRLNGQLKDLFHANASVKLLAASKADLVMRITLKELKNQFKGLNILQDAGGVTFELIGKVELEDRISRETIWEENYFSVELTENSGISINSSDLRVYEHLYELTALFAKKIYERIFVEF